MSKQPSVWAQYRIVTFDHGPNRGQTWIVTTNGWPIEEVADERDGERWIYEQELAELGREP